MFHPAMWNVAELFEHDLSTTNNHVEAWHRRLQTLIAIDHSSFYASLHKLYAKNNVEDFAVNVNGAAWQSTLCGWLTALMSDLRCGRKDLTASLRGVRHAFGKSELAEDADVADGTSDSDGEDVNQQVPSHNADHTGNVQVGYLRFYRAKPNA